MTSSTPDPAATDAAPGASATRDVVTPTDAERRAEHWTAVLDAWEVWVGHARAVVVGDAPTLPVPPALPFDGPPPDSLVLRAFTLLDTIEQLRQQGAHRLHGEVRAGFAYAAAAR